MNAGMTTIQEDGTNPDDIGTRFRALSESKRFSHGLFDNDQDYPDQDFPFNDDLDVTQRQPVISGTEALISHREPPRNVTKVATDYMTADDIRKRKRQHKILIVITVLSAVFCNPLLGGLSVWWAVKARGLLKEDEREAERLRRMSMAMIFCTVLVGLFTWALILFFFIID